MKTFSARTLIDDILLLVRNNNISESEDLSRDLILSWILLYKSYLTKKKLKEDSLLGDDIDDSLVSTIGPIELTTEKTTGNCCCEYSKRTKEKIHTIQDSCDDIISIHDASGCVIQYMHNIRKHYHRFRRYTHSEPTCWFEGGYIYINGEGIEDFKYIYITGVFDPSLTADSEDDIDIPGWMIPDIKKAIMTNELAFMLKMPSDDSNNSTLANVKPNGPKDKEE